LLNRPIVATLVLAFLLVPAIAAQISVEFDESVDFKGYQTYALREGTPARRLEVQIRIEGYIARELDQRGLRLVEESPDLIVRTYALVDKLTLEQLANQGTWEFYTGLTDMDAYSVKAGTLVVDIADASGEKVLWRGLVAAPVSGSVESVERKLDKAVAKMFRRFPR
jgi:hypothetical protein